MRFGSAVCIPALATVVGVFAPLGAQTLADATMPLPPGVAREKGIEAQMAATKGPETQLLMVYRSSAPVEMLVGWYKRRLATAEDIPLDTASLQPGGATAISYHLTFHAFVNECMDPGPSAGTSSDSGATCKKWRRGIDKRRALDNSRVAFKDGTWVEFFTLTWYERTLNGELVRRQIEVRDTGLSKNWQHDELRSQITLERQVVSRAGQ